MMKLLHDFMLEARSAEDVALTQEMVNDKQKKKQGTRLKDLYKAI